jgi:CRISPR-associated protein Cmr5
MNYKSIFGGVIMSDNSTMTGIEQGRANFAYQCAEEAIKFKFLNGYSKEHEPENIQGSLFYTFLEKKWIKPNDKQKKEKVDKIKSFLDPESESITEKNIKEFIEKYGKEYKANVKKVPMYIKTNGLGAAFAFINSKAKDGNAWQLIYKQTAEWLKYDKKIISDDFNDLTKMIVSKESVDYRALTIEILAFFNWLRRFAEGLIEGED